MRPSGLASDLGSVVLALSCGHVTIALEPTSKSALLWEPLVLPSSRRESSALMGRTSISALAAISAPAQTDVPSSTSPRKAASNGALTGIADRYGGTGIGRNGGSGRNALVDGFLVKGIGRTPLVSASTPLSHASGGAYLEECVREAIFAEVVGHDFPYGAVPTLGILDTGLVQAWPEGIEPGIEPRTLLVRPPFARPAHFERALGFDSGLPFEGERDHQRVKAVFAAAVSAVGKDGLLHCFDQFWTRWAHQLAYGFVHRLSHGNNTSSNISLDGRLVDFGAASTVPSWQNCATSYHFDSFVNRMTCIVMSMRSLYYYVGRHLDQQFAARPFIDARTARCQQAFKRFAAVELLRICGVDDLVAADCAKGSTFDLAWHACFEAIDHAQRTKLDLLEPGTYSDAAWDIRKAWSPHPPKHLRRLSQVVSDLIPSQERDAARDRSRRLSASRPDLYKPNLRARFFAEVQEKSVPNLGADPAFVQDFIRRHVCANLRELAPRPGSASVNAAWSAAVPT